jgi:tetratricopeptide (TPR) repeat protein
LHQALEIWTPETAPVESASTLNNLANTYRDRVRGERADNLRQAAQALQRALDVAQPRTLPTECRLFATNLGDLYFDEGQWLAAAQAYKTALQAAETLYRASLLDESRREVLAQGGELHRRAAYALARAGCLQDAVVTLERGRARGLRESLDRDRVDLA